MGYVFKPDAMYLMPTISPMRIHTTPHYGDITLIYVRYLTEREALAALLPHPFEPADEPVVRVYCLAAKQVDFMAGRGYNIVGVDLAAVFHGTKDYCAGNYAVVLWESDTIPIIAGREMLGAPKLYADIPEPRQEGAACCFECSLYGNKMVEGTVRNLIPLPAPAIREAEQAANGSPWMGWKYIPKADWSGPDVSYATIIPCKFQLREVSVGEGSHKFHDRKWEEVLHSGLVLEGLRTLLVKEYMDAGVVQGSADLLVSESRALE